MSYFVVEGGIGTGKTTFCNVMSDLLKESGAPCSVLEEPVVDNPYLESFWADPKRYAFALQMWFMNARHKMHKVAGKAPGLAVLDRSLVGDFVFAVVNNKLGNISDEEFKMYRQYYDLLSETVPSTSLIVYLRVEPEVNLERARRRGRPMEAGLTLDYLQRIHDAYEATVDHLSSLDCSLGWANTKWLTLEWGEDQTDVRAAIRKVAPVVLDSLGISTGSTNATA